MTQKTLTCTACGMSIRVSGLEPDEQINCPGCRASVTEAYAVATEGQPEPQPVQAGHRMRPSYPGKELRATPALVSLTGRKGLIMALVIGGAILTILVASVAYGMMGAGVDPDGEWHHHVSEAGQYEVDFPEQPRVFSESATSPNGDREYRRAQYTTSNFKFQVSYFRLGEESGEVSYDFDEAARALAEESNASLRSGSKSRTVGDFEGKIFSMKPPRQRETTVLFLRRDDFVYIVLCENYPSGQQATADRFIDSFKLVSTETESANSKRTANGE